MAGALFIGIMSAFGFMLKTSTKYFGSAGKKAQELYSLRSEMEQVRMTPFADLTGLKITGLKITPLSADLYLVQLDDKLFTLRSRY